MATVIGTTVFEKIKTENSSGFKAISQAKYKTCNATNINNKLIIKKKDTGRFYLTLWVFKFMSVRTTVFQVMLQLLAGMGSMMVVHSSFKVAAPLAFTSCPFILLSPN